MAIGESMIVHSYSLWPKNYHYTPAPSFPRFLLSQAINLLKFPLKKKADLEKGLHKCMRPLAILTIL